jgi:hypothetical protein
MQEPCVHPTRSLTPLLVLLLVLMPRAALALPSPFVVVMIGNVLVTALTLVAVSLPLLFYRTSRRLERVLRRPGAKLGGLLLYVLALGMLLGLGPLFPIKEVGPGHDALAARLSACQPLDALLARRLDLPRGAMVVDLRPNEVFRAYHLLGSCNLTKDELLKDPEVARVVADTPAKIVMLASDGAIDPDAVFREASPGGGPRDRRVDDLAGGAAILLRRAPPR